MNFYETAAGKRFFEGQLPKLISTLQEISAALRQRPSPAPILVGSPDSKLLHDLFYGQYEPYFETPNSAEYQEANRKASMFQKQLRAELDPEVFLKIEDLLGLFDHRNSIDREQAFCVGYRCAVQLLMCGLFPPDNRIKKEGALSDGEEV